jgi:hypothetical protein
MSVSAWRDSVSIGPRHCVNVLIARWSAPP